MESGVGARFGSLDCNIEHPFPSRPHPPLTRSPFSYKEKALDRSAWGMRLPTCGELDRSGFSFHCSSCRSVFCFSIKQSHLLGNSYFSREFCCFIQYISREFCGEVHIFPGSFWMFLNIFPAFVHRDSTPYKCVFKVCPIFFTMKTHAKLIK